MVAHPMVGDIEVDCDVMVDGDSEQKIVLLSTAPATESHSRMQLAVVVGVAPAP